MQVQLSIEEIENIRRYNLILDKDKILKFHSLANTPEYAPNDPNIGFNVYGDEPHIQNRIFYVSMHHVDYQKSRILTSGTTPEDLSDVENFLSI